MNDGRYKTKHPQQCAEPTCFLRAVKPLPHDDDRGGQEHIEESVGEAQKGAAVVNCWCGVPGGAVLLSDGALVADSFGGLVV